MKRQMRALMAAIIVFVVLLSVYGGLAIKNNRELLEVPEQEGDAAGGLGLVDADFEDIQKVELHNPHLDITLIRQDDQWALVEYPDFRLNQVAVSTFVWGIVGLTGRDEIQADSLGPYGLETPGAKAKVYLADGTDFEVYAGAQTPDKIFYYMMVSGDDTVYTVQNSFGERFYNGYDTYLRKTLPIIDKTEMTRAEIILEDGHYAFAKGLPNGQEYLVWATEVFVTTEPVAGIRMRMDYMYQEVLNTFEDFWLSGVVMGTREYADFGLESPALNLYLEDNEERIRLYVGDENDSGERYILIEGDPYIYRMASRILEPFFNIDKSRAFDRKLVNVVESQAVTVTVAGEENAVVQIKDSDPGKAVYKKLTELSWDSAIDAEPDWEADNLAWRLTIAGAVDKENTNPKQVRTQEGLYEDSGSQLTYTLTYDFYEYNEYFYAISREGGPLTYAIARNSVDGVLRELAALGQE